jgi:hypothetical protein
VAVVGADAATGVRALERCNERYRGSHRGFPVALPGAVASVAIASMEKSA